MEKNKGLTLISLVITIIILLILAGVSINLIIGDNGILARATNVEVTFNKSEVIEEINILATEKYLDAYNKASAAADVANLSDYYNPTKVIYFLQGKDDEGNDIEGAKKYIEPLAGHTDTDEDVRYFIIIDSLGRSINRYGKGTNGKDNTDYFYIKATRSNGQILTAKVFYKGIDPETKDEEVGDIVFEPKL